MPINRYACALRLTRSRSLVLSLTTSFVVAGCVVTETDPTPDPTYYPGLAACLGDCPTTCVDAAACDSGLCAEDSGTCIAPSAIVYVSPAGTGTACTQHAPCGDLATAAAAVAPGRADILMAPGRYLGGASFSAALDVRIYGRGAHVLDGSQGSTISAVGSGAVTIYDLAAQSTQASFACASGGALTLRRIDARGMLGVHATDCAALTIADSRFSGGYGVVASASHPQPDQVQIDRTSFLGATIGVRLDHVNARISTSVFEGTKLALDAAVDCMPGTTCVEVLDSEISGASTRTMRLEGQGYLIARNHIHDNPAGGISAKANALRIESNVIRDNGSNAAATVPGLALEYRLCQTSSCAPIVVIGNTIANNRGGANGMTARGAGVDVQGLVAPVLVSNIIADNVPHQLSGPQVRCQITCDSYNDLIRPNYVTAVRRTAPIDGDPQFASSESGDLRPLPGSPARNSGLCAPSTPGVTAMLLDVTSAARNAPCDAGAYEIP